MGMARYLSQLLNSSGVVNHSKMPTGSVLQVVNVVSNTNATTSTSTSASTGISVSITPKFSTSKIAIFVSGTCRIGVGASVRFQIWRNNATILTPYTQNQQAGSGSIQFLDSGFSLNNLDAPATTSSTTYTLYFYSVQSIASQVNPDNATTEILLMEIAG